jgi:hypothetical protein
MIVALCVCLLLLMLAMVAHRHHPVREVEISIITGLAVGVPGVLLQKWVLRRQVTFYAEFYQLSYSERLRWRIVRRNFLYILPGMMSIYLPYFVLVYKGISPLPAACAVAGLYMTTYPEQKAIYLAAEARAEENDPDADR